LVFAGRLSPHNWKHTIGGEKRKWEGREKQKHFVGKCMSHKVKEKNPQITPWANP